MAVARSSLPLQLTAIEPGFVWRRLRAQPLAFQLTSAFVLLEYVRPMAAYSALDFLPWSRIALISATVACLIRGRLSFRNTLGWTLIGMFTAVILASSALAVYPAVSATGLQLWGSWLLFIFIVSSAADTEERLFLTIGLFLLWNVKMSQYSLRSWAGAGFAFRDWGIVGAPGWFSNSGEFAIEMCVFFSMVVYFLAALWPSLSTIKRGIFVVLAATGAIGVIGSSSRGGMLGLAAIALYVVLMSPKRWVGLLSMVGTAALAYLLLPPESKARFQTAGTDGTSLNRLTYWTDGIKIAQEHPILGIGFNNWLPYYRTYYNPKGALPHNIFIEAWAQLGYLGLGMLLILIAYVFYENFQVRRLTRRQGPRPNRFLYFTSYGLDAALVGYLVSGFFVTVLFYPFFWFNLALVIALSNLARQRQIVYPKPSSAKIELTESPARYRGPVTATPRTPILQ